VWLHGVGKTFVAPHSGTLMKDNYLTTLGNMCKYKILEVECKTFDGVLFIGFKNVTLL